MKKSAAAFNHRNLFFSMVLVMLVCFSFRLTGQNKEQTGWSKTVFDQPCFIQNAGQFDDISGEMGPVLYGVRQQGMEIYFAAKGILYRHPRVVFPPREQGHEKDKSSKANEERPARVFENVRMHWLNANTLVQVTSSKALKNYFTYSNLRDKTGSSSIKAQAFQEIVYHNLYPGIDVAYAFVPGKTGIKYTVTVHPGADVSQLQMGYDPLLSVSKDAAGNCIIQTSFGPLTDEAPAPAYTEKQFVSCVFRTTGNKVGFELGGYDHNQTLVIDPWIRTPPFPNLNKAYDIDWDYQGNVYVYGGAYPYRLSKLNAAGTILWTFSGTSIGDSMHLDYGDFAIDRSTGTAFLSEGFNLTGARILKVSTGGIQLALSAHCTDAGEFWRIAFNSCTRKGVVACGCNSCQTSTVNAIAATFDYNLTSIHAVNVLSGNPLDSVWAAVDNTLLCIDDTSAFIMTCDYTGYNGPNGILKCPVSTLSPRAYYMPTAYHFQERQSISYIEGVGLTNGFNGMAKSRDFLYTYNGAVLEKRNPWNGLLLQTLTVSADSFKCGGISVDACNNLFIGTVNSVKQYNATNLVLMNTFPTTDTVYDVTIKYDSILACGAGFVSFLGYVPPSCGCFASCDSPRPCNEPITPPGTPCVTFATDTIPNIFSPNGDGKNDFFYPVQNHLYTPDQISNMIGSYNLEIYDRWGVKLFQSGNYSTPWNGSSMQGKAVAEGVYYWILSYKSSCPGSVIVSKTGFVHLVR